MKIVAAGEILWDLIRGEEFLGGAPLNFAVNAHRLGHEAVLVSAIGDDDRGDRALARIEQLGLSTKFIRQVPHPTGIVTVTLDQGEPDYMIHRPAAYDFLEAAPIEADWLYFGTLAQTGARARAAIATLSASIPKRFYDLNLRKDFFTPELVASLITQSTAIKMNQHEASILGARDVESFCRSLGKRYVAITRGAEGCAVWIEGDYAESGGVKIELVDAVGAGDAFAAAFLDGIGEGWRAKQVAEYANRAGALVASRPGAIPDWSKTEFTSPL